MTDRDVPTDISLTKEGDPRPDREEAPAERIPLINPLFRVVMVEPEIPNNTGNIGRTCLAFGSALHLVHPLGFDLSERALRRAGLDYWPRLRVAEHADWSAYTRDAPLRGARRWLTSGLRGVPAWDADLRPGDHLVFGKETAGLPGDLLDEAERAAPDNGGGVLTFPMAPGERGLNVATAVCAMLCEGARQCVARGDARVGPGGRLLLPR